MKTRRFVPISWHAFQGLSYFYDGGGHPLGLEIFIGDTKIVIAP